MFLFWSVVAKRGPNAVVTVGCVLLTVVAGRAEEDRQLVNLAASVVECVRVFDASPGRLWREAEGYAAARTDCDVLVGRGGSMLPLFPDGTIIVVRRTPLADLRVGMTVVFLGDRGLPVAHILVENTSGGWIAKGLANGDVDRTRVRRGNYVGRVVRAYLPKITAEPVVAESAAPPKAETAASVGAQ